MDAFRADPRGRWAEEEVAWAVYPIGLYVKGGGLPRK